MSRALLSIWYDAHMSAPATARARARAELTSGTTFAELVTETAHRLPRDATALPSQWLQISVRAAPGAAMGKKQP